MKTYNEIYSDLRELSSTLKLEGSIPDAFIRLLAYGVYIKETEIASYIIESSPSSCTKLSSAIYHASEKLYSTFRGKLPEFTFTNVTIEKPMNVKSGDLCTSANGYYYYFKDNLKHEGDSPVTENEVKFLVTRVPRKVITFPPNSDLDPERLYYDILTEVFTDNIMIFSNGERLITTEDPYEFLTSKTDGKYTYDLLLTTLPNYSIKITRHSDTDDWVIKQESGNSRRYTIYNFPYSDKVPTNKNILLPNLNYYYNSNNPSVTEAVPRDFNINEIINNSISLWNSKQSITSTSDLINLLNLDYPGEYFIKYKVGYCIIFYHSNASDSQVKESAEKWARSVYVVEDFVPVEITIKDPNVTTYNITVKVDTSSKLTVSQLKELQDKYQKEYVNKIFYFSQIYQDIAEIDPNSTRLEIECNETSDSFIDFKKTYTISDPNLGTIEGPALANIILTLGAI